MADLRLEDTGTYTCRAISETGETSWSAGLIVESQSNHNIVFHRTPESSTFPGAPFKPAISDITETSMKLTWKPHSNSGASPVQWYTVEYFSHDTGEVLKCYCRIFWLGNEFI
jgi:roundabout axon guidance receptor 2